MAAQGYNSVWQDNKHARKDGSLSVYFGEKRKRYVNIETEHGKFEKYTEMLSKLLTILSKEKNYDSAPAHNSGNIHSNP